VIEEEEEEGGKVLDGEGERVTLDDGAMEETARLGRGEVRGNGDTT